jgi:hypothetical protein
MTRARADTIGARKPLRASTTNAEFAENRCAPTQPGGIKVYQPAPRYLRRDLCISMSTSWLA